MLFHYVVISTLSILRTPRLLRILNPHQLRSYHHDGRNRLSAFWVPTGGIERKPALLSSDKEDITTLLHRAGYLRQSHAGIFELLPLGLCVQDKLIRLVDTHMQSLGASKLSLSSFASEELWDQSGRLVTGKQELFRVRDRKGGKFLLAPTHEEKVTNLVAGMVTSHKDLPLRLYQVTRKYRDELRPRGGLLRAREFLMKDLYTFDADVESALGTYAQVRTAYRKFFNGLGLRYLEAEADSGAIGGDLSHEFHYPSPSGEDTLFQCSACEYIINQERLPPLTSDSLSSPNPAVTCPNCHSSNSLKNIAAIEVGHTFHLGTRYSSPLNASFLPPRGAKDNLKIPIQMGCHGIGISRLIAAIASSLSDSAGLNWPRVISPFECVIIPGKGCSDGDATGIYDLLSKKGRDEGGAIEVILDDRRERGFTWKMHDADLVGYPVIVLLGRKFAEGKEEEEEGRMCEVQCRRLGIREEVRVGGELTGFVKGLLARL